MERGFFSHLGFFELMGYKIQKKKSCVGGFCHLGWETSGSKWTKSHFYVAEVKGVGVTLKACITTDDLDHKYNYLSSNW